MQNVQEKKHFAKACQSKNQRYKKVNKVDSTSSSEGSEDDEAYKVELIGSAVTRMDNRIWAVDMQFIHMSYPEGSKKFQCQMDTGTTCDVIGFADLCRIVQDGSREQLDSSHDNLRLYNGTKIRARGKWNMTVKHRGKKLDLDFKVVDSIQPP